MLTRARPPRILAECRGIDPDGTLYELPAEGRVEAVFDGHVCLEMDGPEAPLVDEIDRRVKLFRPPVYEVRVLIRC